MDLSPSMCLSRLPCSVFGFDGTHTTVFKSKRHGFVIFLSKRIVILKLSEIYVFEKVKFRDDETWLAFELVLLETRCSMDFVSKERFIEGSLS